MSLELAAQHLASRGRKGDTMLVHMAPEEVSGLQALAKAGGGTLTLNPDTGLPEANFLKRMLPMLIGVGLAAATGGAAAPGLFGLSNAATIGLGLGGLETARTGSLSKGLMAGLGAYGGAGLAGGLMGAGAQNVAGQQIAGEAAKNAAAEGIALAPNYAQTAAATATPAQIEAARTGMSGFDLMGKGVSRIGTEGLGAFKSGMTAAGGPSVMRAGLAAAAPVMTGMMQDQAQTPFAGSGPNPYEFEYDPATQRYTRMPVGTRQRDMLAPTTPLMAADGGMMNSGPIEEMSDQNRMDTMMANGGQMFARGGMSHLGDYSDGGRLLKGPGDGVSDSIPATIANKRPARLADGEFVVPARIVSELGNGSTEAGARKLYAMMDRVQRARGKTTGKNRVAVNSRADKLLPA
jgi:hypothetical protein